jgi:glucosamine-6-phosphate deaminase
MTCDVAVLADAESAGEHVATMIATLVGAAMETASTAVVGCPAGRTPGTTYAALGRIAARDALDLTRLRIVMMDEYVEPGRCVEPGGPTFRACSPDAPHSCHRYAERELRDVLNAGLPHGHRLPAMKVHFPDPADPGRYDDEIAALGGIDLFVLAAGATDGHVAFNPPGSTATSRTRVVELAETTRRDNLRTFPTFGSVDDVPRHGLTVGLGTIARLSRRVVLLLLGDEKRAAFERTVATADFDPSWPASVVHLCRDACIVADRSAAPNTTTTMTATRGARP